jgi:uncharacterized protein YlxW (UPF0749 family)
MFEWTDSNVTALAGLVTSVVAGFGGYLTAKRSSKMSEREMLSKDEQAFRQELRNELQAYREEVIKLRVENQYLIKQVEELTSELRKWKSEGGIINVEQA